MWLDEALAKVLCELHQYPFDGDLQDGDCWLDLEDSQDETSPMNLIGKRWAVVIDFHF